MTYLEQEVFPGGCFFVTAATEFDNWPGEVCNAIAENMQDWLGYLQFNTQQAIDLGHLISEIEPKQLAFELHAFYMGANWTLQLYRDEQAANRARIAILTRLEVLKTREAPDLPDKEIYC